MSAVRQAADGSCTGAPVSFSAGVNYTLTTNDFTAGGGDGYPNFRSRIDDAGHPRPGSRGLPRGRARRRGQPGDPDRIHCTDSNPGGGTPARSARRSANEARGPAASCGGPPLPAPQRRARDGADDGGEQPPARPVAARRPAAAGGSRGSPVIAKGFPSARAGTRQRKIRWISLRRRLDTAGGSACPSSGCGGRARRSVEPSRRPCASAGGAVGSAERGHASPAGIAHATQVGRGRAHVLEDAAPRRSGGTARPRSPARRSSCRCS